MPNLLIIYDRPGWCYQRRADALVKYAPDDWHVDAVEWRTFMDHTRHHLTQYQAILLLDYAQAEMVHALRCAAGKIPFVVSFNADAKRRQGWWPRIAKAADYVVCVNRERFNERDGVLNCCFIPNGFDPGVFYPGETLEWSAGVLWCGTVKQRHIKRYDQVIVPLRRLLDNAITSHDFRFIKPGDDLYDAQRQAEWYRSGAAVLCTSKSEGTANTITEAVACGCVAVSTTVGTIVEWGRHRENCMLVEPSAAAVADAVEWMMFRSERHATLATAGIQAVQPFRYDRVAPYYFDLFDELVNDRAPPPFAWPEGCHA